MSILSIQPRVGLPLEEAQATVIHATPIDSGWVLLALRWRDGVTPYVVWYARNDSSPEGKTNLHCLQGSYFFEHQLAEAINEYARRGGAL